LGFWNEVKVIMVPWKRSRTERIKNLECNSADNAIDRSRQAMSNLEGSREESETSSRIGRATTTPLRLSDFPLELILRIASQLGVRDLLAFRKVRSKLKKLKSS